MFCSNPTRVVQGLLIGVAMLVATGPAQAAIVTFDMDYEFSGATPPAGAGPWLRAEFDDGGGSGSVTMTLTALNLVGTEFVRFWDFNLDPAFNPNSLVFSAPTKTGVFTDPVISTGVDAFQADGDGLFDIELMFDNAPPADRFGAGDAVQYTITLPGLTANSFNVNSAPAGGNGPFPTAAHVQGIGSDGSNSGWIAPEPGALSLALIGAFGLLRRNRARRA